MKFMVVEEITGLPERSEPHTLKDRIRAVSTTLRKNADIRMDGVMGGLPVAYGALMNDWKYAAGMGITLFLYRPTASKLRRWRYPQTKEGIFEEPRSTPTILFDAWRKGQPQLEPQE